MKRDEMINYCQKNIPYYKKEWPVQLDHFEQIPFLQQSQVREEFKEFVKPGTVYKMKKTSGSAGVAMKIAYTDEDEVRSKFSMYYLRHKIHGIEPNDRYCSFMNSDPDKMVHIDKNHLSLSNLNICDDTIPFFYNEITKFQPTWIFMRPSIGTLLANYIKENNLPIVSSLKYIEMSGEYLSVATKKLIQAAFKLPVYNMYGCMESNGIAYECEYGHLHVLSNNVFLEVIRDGKAVWGEQGDIAITTLNNYTMPFIRYMNGDKGILRKSTCLCGNKNPIIELQLCRNKFLLSLPDKKQKDLASLDYIIHMVNEVCDDAIMQCQFEQVSIYDVNVRIVLAENVIDTEQMRENLTDMFYRYAVDAYLTHISWNIVLVSKIFPEAQTGKVRFFIDSINKN